VSSTSHLEDDARHGATHQLVNSNQLLVPSGTLAPTGFGAEKPIKVECCGDPTAGGSPQGQVSSTTSAMMAAGIANASRPGQGSGLFFGSLVSYQ